MNDVGALHQGYRAAWSVTVDAGRELEECVSERLRRLLCDEVPDAVDVDRGDGLADLAQRHLGEGVVRPIDREDRYRKGVLVKHLTEIAVVRE